MPLLPDLDILPSGQPSCPRFRLKHRPDAELSLKSAHAGRTEGHLRCCCIFRSCRRTNVGKRHSRCIWSHRIFCVRLHFRNILSSWILPMRTAGPSLLPIVLFSPAANVPVQLPCLRQCPCPFRDSPMRGKVPKPKPKSYSKTLLYAACLYPEGRARRCGSRHSSPDRHRRRTLSRPHTLWTIHIHKAICVPSRPG